MAKLPVGAVLLTTLVIAAAAGFDPRKKKKSSHTQLPPEGAIAKCPHLFGYTQDGTSITIDGQVVEAGSQDWVRMAAESNRPQVIFTVCRTSSSIAELIDEVCRNTPDADFYVEYVELTPAPLMAQNLQRCAEAGNPLIGVYITTPSGRTFSDREYNLYPTQNPGDWVAYLLAALYS